MKKILIIGTAPLPAVQQAVARFSQGEAELHLLVRDRDVRHFGGETVRLHTFKGKVGLLNHGILKALFAVRPHEEIVVTGEHYFHDNVISTLRAFNALLGINAAVFAIAVRPGTDWDSPLFSSWYEVRPGFSLALSTLLFLVAALLLAGAFAAFGWAGVAGAAAAFLTSELFLHLYRKNEPALRRMQGDDIFSITLRQNYHQENHAASQAGYTRPPVWQEDPTFGFVYSPNLDRTVEHSIPGLGLSFRWSFKTDANGYRHLPAAAFANPGAPTAAVSFYGCSMTWGHGVDDDDAYPNLIQLARPDLRVRNYANPGHSLYQTLLRMEQTVPRDKPKVVVLGFHLGLPFRTTLSMEHLLLLAGRKAPYCVSRGGKLRRYPVTGYPGLPFSSLSSVLRLAELGMCRLLSRGRSRAEVFRRTTEHVLLQMRKLCEDNGARFLVFLLDKSDPYVAFLHEKGFNICTCGLHLAAPDANGRQPWNLLPFDSHPNAAAHARYQQRLLPALERLIQDGKLRPDEELLAQAGIKTETAVNQYIYPLF